MEPPSKRCRQVTPPGLLPLDSPGPTPCLPTGVHKKCTAGDQTLQRIYSVERVFGSQTLDTPGATATHASADCLPRQRSCDCEFRISYSQNYVRVPSFSQEDEKAEKRDGAAEDAGPSSLESCTEHFSLQPLAASCQGEAATTPELCPEPGSKVCSTSKKFFPLFRPKSQWKTLHIIRHGESEFNAASSARSQGFSDPQVYDPKLTFKGRNQAVQLRAKLEAMKISADALWVTSPLTRALETMLLACPQSKSIGSSEAPLNVAVRGELSEICQTTGDIGLPATDIRRSFPQFDEALRELPERWWHRHEDNDAIQRRFQKPETQKQMRARAGEFRKWVQSRPEKVIVAFGHNCLFKELTNGQKSLRNCEVHTMAI